MTFSTYFVVALSFTFPVAAQNRPVLISPEVQTDRSVVLRYWAPPAGAVQLSGNWMGSQPPMALSKGEGGVWTVTVPPLVPNLYS